MEDRVTPGLYLEMSSVPPAEYVDTRLPEVLDLPGVEAASWWENAHPDRNDLPRKLDEFSLLSVFEVNEDFKAPPAPAWVGRLDFRRYPRPGQGIITGRPTVGLLLVLIGPRSASGAQALRDWADFVHIRHIAECGVPGYCMITPYENATGGYPRFMHFYEMDTDDPETAFKMMPSMVEARLGGGPGNPSFDRWASHPELQIVYVNTFRRLGGSSRRAKTK